MISRPRYIASGEGPYIEYIPLSSPEFLNNACSKKCFIVYKLYQVDVPTEIQNAMAIVYRPTRGQNDITALLVWNQNDVEEQIDTYTVEISRNGSMIVSLLMLSICQ